MESFDIMNDYKKTNNKLIFILSVILFLWLILNVLNATSYFTPDEYYQIIEFASYKLGISSATSLPWEFKEEIRQAFQPFLVYSLFKFLHLIQIDDSSTSVYILRILNSLFSVFSIVFFALKSRSKFDPKFQNLYLIALCTFWVIPNYFFRFSQEIVAQNLYLIITGILISKNISKKEYIITGILVGIAFLVRFQSIISFFGICIWSFLDKTNSLKINFKNLLGFCLGFIGIFGVGLLIDAWFYQDFVFVLYRYFYYNIVLGVANGFGTHPIYFYFMQILTIGSPLMGILIFTSWLGSIYKKAYSLPLIIFSTNVVILSLISHKEERFLFVVYLYIPFILMYFLQNIHFKSEQFRKKIVYAFLFVNFCIILLSTLFHLQVLSDNEKSLQKYMIQNYKNQSFDLYYNGSCHPFMDKVKIDLYKDTQYLYHNFLMPKTYNDYDITKVNQINTSRKNILYARKSIYLENINQGLNIGKGKVIKKSIPNFIDQLIDNNPILSKQFNNSIIYLVEF